MKAHDWFGLIVRSVGLISFVHGGYSSIGLLAPDPEFSRIDYLPGCAVAIFLGLLLIVEADTVVAVSYRHNLRNQTPPLPPLDTTVVGR